MGAYSVFKNHFIYLSRLSHQYSIHIMCKFMEFLLASKFFSIYNNKKRKKKDSQFHYCGGQNIKNFELDILGC